MAHKPTAVRGAYYLVLYLKKRFRISEKSMLKWRYSIIFCIILTIGYWAYNDGQQSQNTDAVTSTQESADYFMEKAQITQYGVQGNLQYKLSSKSISHYPHSNSTLLSKPYMISYKKSGQITTLDALYGKLLATDDILELWNNVVMIQSKPKSGEQTTMNTEYMTVLSNKGIAETNKPVLITNNHSLIRAVGMQTFYDKGLINLKSRVRGTHEPE